VGRQTIALVMLLLTAASFPAFGSGLDAQMEDMFNTMSTGTQPGASMGPRRGTLYGGSFQMRTPIVRPGPLISMEAPRVSGGCGGIDLFGGSFSAVSSDQFKDLGRAIASNAAGYAFKMGLAAICPKCEGIMTDLQDTVRGYNFQMMDSCQIAQGIAHPDAEVRQQRRAEMSASFQRLGTNARDMFSANNHAGSTNEAPPQSLARENPDAAKKVLGGNAMWEVMKQGRIWESLGVSSTSERADLMQDIMSITGTVVGCQPGETECDVTVQTGGEEERTESSWKRMPDIMRFSELVLGSEAENPIRYYRCNGGFNGPCTKLAPAGRQMKGLKQRFVDRIVGPPGSPEQGLIYRYRNRVGVPGTADVAILGAGGEFTSRVIRYAKANPALAERFTREFAEQVAAEVMAKEIKRLFRELKQAVSRSETPGKDELFLLLANADAAVELDLSEILRSATVRADVMSHFDMQEERAIADHREILPTSN